ncbi:MAG: PLP-dependent aminotransferase family protein [Kofleriaceae bacterium]
MWKPVLALDPADSRPKFLQLAETLSADVARGRLHAGDPLPSTRDLAAQLGVHRKTVTAAYRELASQGWIALSAGRTARVVADVPASPRRARERHPATRAGFELRGVALAHAPPLGRPPRQLLLLGGVPELRFVPQLAVGRAYRSVLAGRDGARLLDYRDGQGDAQLRVALADMLRGTRGLACTEETVAVVRGGQQALYLLARVLLRPGDRVAVEALSYPAALAAFRAAGVEPVPVALDREGLDVAALEELCAQEDVRAIYVIPHHQVPTTVTLSAARRLRLLELARRRRLPIIEDDHDHEFQYDGRPVLPLTAADPHGNVVYVGTLAKVLAPGLRIGYLSATRDVVERVVAYREAVDQQGDHVLERAIANLITDGTIARHIRRARRAYRQRRDALIEALRRQLPELRFTTPPGGMAVWGRAPGVDAVTWATRARAVGVSFQPGPRFALDGGATHHVRLGFAACTEQELDEAVRRMAATMPRRRGATPASG